MLDKLAAAVPPNVRAVCEKLAAAGHQAVTVGGAVRDAILGRDPGDWDVATSAHPDQVIALFPRTIPTGLQHGTVTIVTGKGEHTHVEVTTFRGEGAYSDARRPDHVTFGVPLVDDLARRDLRVNAMAYDVAKNELIDPFGGQRDLAERMLRAVGPTGDVYTDAVARFTEDGLRVMRAVRFAAVLEFALDPETERGIAPALPSLAKVSRERVADELRKILAARQPSRALAIAERTGILTLILADVAAGLEVWANALGVTRPEAVTRWLARIDAAPEPSRLGALIAELGDPLPELRRLDRSSQRRADTVLRALKFSNDEAQVAAVLAGVAAASRVTEWTDGELRRLLSDVGRARGSAAVGLWRAAGAAWADRAAAILDRRDALATGDLAVTGNDLMTALEMTAGPELGRMLAALLDRVLDDPSLNTRESLIAIARGLELSLAR